VVEQVEDVRAKLKTDHFRDRRTLLHRQIEVVIAGVVELVAAGRRIGARRSVRERSGFEPLDVL